ncbi:MAG TPA: hypothetical protein VNL96_07825 [Gemmatimonadaceae bacterium]|nr:hypothetical protein [Gemmatimonadaceae bacterium]
MTRHVEWRTFSRRRHAIAAARRSGPAAVVSVLAHVALLALLVHLVRTPLVVERIFGIPKAPPALEEHVTFVGIAPDRMVSAVPSRLPSKAGVRPDRASEPVAAPVGVPVAVPPAPSPAGATGSPAAGAGGPVTGGGGATRGVQPTFADPRVWVADPPFVYAPKTAEERLDSALVTSLERYKDSLARFGYSPNRFERGDWTVEKDGKKYGIDREYIRLGRFSLPTALLALLPLNKIQANPIAAERERSMAAIRGDILYHAEAAMNEEEFRRAVKAIRDRKEREQKAKREQQSKGRTPPTTSPGERPPR